MSSTSVSPHGFVTVRGRGYRPEQVDAYAAALSGDRDAAWERAARLTVLAKEMETGLERLREKVATLAPQGYDTLGEGARRIWRLAEEEAATVRESARREARDGLERAEAYAGEVCRAAREEADAVRAEAEERARQRLLVARARAHELRVGARRTVKELRGEALAAVRDMRQRTPGLLVGQEGDQAERWAALEREAGARVAGQEARQADAVARAEAGLSCAKRDFAEAEDVARARCAEAGARADAILAEAREKADRIARDTERVLREHGETWDDVQAHMDALRDSLTSLAGRAAALE